MPRIGIISDLHADVHALEDALDRMDDISCDEIVCCGDLVDYGLFPDETIKLLAERRVLCVRGNHDRWAIEGGGEHGGGWDLSRSSRRFLAGLPAFVNLEHEGVRVAVHHASPSGDMNGIDPNQIDFALASAYLRQAQADILVVGHTHLAYALNVKGRGMIVNPAALLRSPSDGADNPPATGTYGVLDLSLRRFTVHHATDGSEVEIMRRHIVG